MPNFRCSTTFHFYLFGLIAIASALAFVTRKSPVAAALWLVTTMFCLAALYVLLDAQFIGAIQVLVYAGAIMVLFLFVIMLLNLGHPSRAGRRARALGWKLAAGAVGLALLAQVVRARRRAQRPGDARRCRSGFVARTGRATRARSRRSRGRCSTSTCSRSS